VQKALGDWAQAAIDMDTNEKKIGPARTALGLLISTQRILLRRWTAQRRAFFSAVNIHIDGSKDMAQNLACEVFSQQPLPPQGVPQNVRDLHLKTRGSAGVTWDKMVKHDFMVQTCTNPADAATYAEPMHVTRRRVTFANQTPGATLHVRVQTLDSKLPNGKSDYSPWVAIIVAV
jgi:hypothetical protein